MIRLQLSPKGDLVALEVRPPSEGRAGDAPPQVDWNPALVAAGLDPSRLVSVQPLQVPPMAFDTRVAWTGTYAAGRSEQVRVEAASWRGRTVFFNLRGDWQKGAALDLAIPRVALTILMGTAILILTAGGILARRNVRQGRGDRRGAAWLATLGFGAVFGSWILLTHHVPAVWEMGLLFKSLCVALFLAVTVAVSYLAIEPFARRFWPDAFISMTRLQAGRYRDPLVASHILGGVVVALTFVLFNLFAMRLIEGRNLIFLPRIDVLGSPSDAAGFLLFDVARTFQTPLLALVLLVSFRQITRRTWPAYILSVIALAVAVIPYGSVYTSPAHRVLGLVAAATPFVLLNRWGLLAFISWQFILWFSAFPLAPASWYTGQTFLLLALPVVVSAWELWVILTAHDRPTNQ
jgi:hypothetical protein